MNMVKRTAENSGSLGLKLEGATARANLATQSARVLTIAVNTFAQALSGCDISAWDEAKKESVFAIIDGLMAAQPVMLDGIVLLEQKMRLVTELVNSGSLAVPPDIQEHCNTFKRSTALSEGIFEDSAPVLARYWSQPLNVLIPRIVREIDDATARVAENNVITSQLCNELKLVLEG
jgi:hypothetical protein